MMSDNNFDTLETAKALKESGDVASGLLLLSSRLNSFTCHDFNFLMDYIENTNSFVKTHQQVLLVFHDHLVTAFKERKLNYKSQIRFELFQDLLGIQ
ncbi:TPA: hypothetical protein I7730_00595 [Vibrio vulnificus]|uniref:Uncharacterized protein n=1 Tax=Vibrio vulnificus TaxID=672 RepID=A0A8H9K6R8_VIBVL|nr:hypothetical protein [Vibrio vulnificus]HAS8538297.1 hypothetical protein [Vibrio vulnificus]